MRNGIEAAKRRYHLPAGIDVPEGMTPADRQRLTATVLAAIGRAVPAAAPGGTGAPQAGARPEPRERVDPSRQRGGYATPSYDDGSGHRVVLPVTLSDELFGITVVTRREIEAKVRRVMNRPGVQAGEARTDFARSPGDARATLYKGHFRDDNARLSYALGYFRTLVESGYEDASALFDLMVTYEAWWQSQRVDVVLSGPPTVAEVNRLADLRRRRRAEVVAREAERVRPERERARRSPEDLSRYPDPAAGGPYHDQGIHLPYDMLVPDPDPRVGYSEDEVDRVLHDPRRFEQLYFDATNGFGKARWLVGQFEWQVRIDGAQSAHNVADVLTGRGLVHVLIGTGGFDFGRYGFSPDTASGRRMFTVFAHAFADKANDVRFSNTVINNLLSLWAAGKLTEAAVANVDIRVPTALPLPSEPLALPASEPLALPPGAPEPLGPAAEPLPPFPEPPVEAATSGAGAPSPRRVGFGPRGGAPATSDTGPNVPLSRRTAGFGRPIEPPPSGVSGPGIHQLPAARQVGTGGDAAAGESGNVTSMSAGKRPKRGGGRQPPPLAHEEFERSEQTEQARVRQGAEETARSEGPIVERYPRVEDAIGQVEGKAKVIDRVRTENPGLRNQGFTETWYVEDAGGTQWTVARNPSTGEFTGAHPSSSNY